MVCECVKCNGLEGRLEGAAMYAEIQRSAIAELEHENCCLQDKIQRQDVLLSELKETIEVFNQEALEAVDKCRG